MGKRRNLAFFTAFMFAAFVAYFCPLAPAAAAGTLFPAKSGDINSRVLTIYSSLDQEIARPLIDSYQIANPSIAIDYSELQTLEIYARVLDESDRDGTTADVAFSSAMDLQVKLANDGYAASLNLPSANLLPDWATWRNAAFGVTFEPAVIVYHKPSFADHTPPRTRAALINYLYNSDNEIFGRIGTYDIERAGLGFFFLARDQEHYRDIWQLVRAMGSAGVKLYSNSSAILERVADGRFALGYNILGSYAASWAASNPDIGIIMPEDYTVVMSRIGLVPRAAKSPDLGAAFLDFLISREGQEVISRDVRLPALHPALTGENTAAGLRAQEEGRLRPVPVSPGLVVYLDQVKRERLISRWNEALRAQ
ncbi:ABC transporter substrate-binding protein [Pelagibius sp. Alg239-R121]|uniref:ABC transporter substrate-binding protein n=1 Tax=Pelagibius sp. Alg239-R121 TaxID=2993448 RepID=UPI002AC36079|nr:ABC transporter substrate-binding protein [Pelagibius sp. Alg239-R121]